MRHSATISGHDWQEIPWHTFGVVFLHWWPTVCQSSDWRNTDNKARSAIGIVSCQETRYDCRMKFDTQKHVWCDIFIPVSCHPWYSTITTNHILLWKACGKPHSWHHFHNFTSIHISLATSPSLGNSCLMMEMWRECYILFKSNLRWCFIRI